MTNIYLSQPNRLSVDTRVEKIRSLGDGGTAIVAVENPVRAAGGGQPADDGTVIAAEGEFPILKVAKSEGDTWLMLPFCPLEVGDHIRVIVDAERRQRLSQGHTLTHLAMAAAREIAPGYESKGADIDEDGVGIELRFMSHQPISSQMAEDIDRRTRSNIARAVPVTIERARSMADAEAAYPMWRVDPDLQLSGRIRVIVIEGIDANPCSGSHVSSTADIGPYALAGHTVHAKGFNILRLEKLEAWTYWY